MFSLKSVLLFAIISVVSAEPIEKRTATNAFPSSPTSTSLSSPITIAAGQSFTPSQAYTKYDRGSGACNGQTEGGDSDAVFLLEEGASLSHVVIGKNQAEGIHCLGSCTLDHVWFEDVCEDAITIKQTSGTSRINYGGALHAEDKVVQHNGGGTVIINSFYVEDFGKLYRSCGNCKTQYTRHVEVNDVWAVDGSVLVGINSNYGDTAKIRTTQVDDVDDICVRYEGNDDGDEPSKIGSGPDSTYCFITQLQKPSSGMSGSYLTTLRPVTVKQVLSATREHDEAQIEIENHAISRVHCVALVRKIVNKERQLRLVVLDTDPTINVTVWKGGSDSEVSIKSILCEYEKGTISENKYVRIFGKVEIREGLQNSINAYAIVPIDDFHEAMYHLFKVLITTRLLNEELSKEDLAKAPVSVLEQRLEPGSETINFYNTTNVIDAPEDEPNRPLEDKSVHFSEEKPVISGPSRLTITNIKALAESRSSSFTQPPAGSNSRSSSSESDSISDSDSEDEDTESSRSGPGRGEPPSHLNEEVVPDSQSEHDDSYSTTSESSVDYPAASTEVQVSSQREFDEPVSSISRLLPLLREAKARKQKQEIDPYADLNNRQRSLVLYIIGRRTEVQSDGDEWLGIDVTEISRYLKHLCKDKINGQQIEDLLDDLTDKNIICPTTDESHYDVCD